MTVFLIIVAILIVLMILICAFEMNHFRAVNYVVSLKGKKTGKSPKLVFISDLHGRKYGKDNEKLLRALKYYSPDVIILGGDMLIGSDPSPNVEITNFLRELPKIAKTYYSFGNHEVRQRDRFPDEFEKYISNVKHYGIEVISGKNTVLENFPDFSLCGLELPEFYYKRIGKKFPINLYVQQNYERPDSEKYNILLSHDPSFFPQLKDMGYDLVLSGHVHGGIVRIPILGGVVSPRLELFPKYDRGRFTEENSEMIISAGTGNHHMPVRINNLPEILILEFTDGENGNIS